MTRLARVLVHDHPRARRGARPPPPACASATSHPGARYGGRRPQPASTVVGGLGYQLSSSHPSWSSGSTWMVACAMSWRRSSDARLVEHAVRVGTGTDHHVRAGDVHLRRQRPHVQVVHVDDTGERAQLGADRVEVDVLGRDLEQHAHRAGAELPRARDDPDRDDRRDDGVDRLPSHGGEDHRGRRSHRPIRRRRPWRRGTRLRPRGWRGPPAQHREHDEVHDQAEDGDDEHRARFDLEVAVDRAGARLRSARRSRRCSSRIAFTSDARISRRNSPNVRTPSREARLAIDDRRRGRARSQPRR